MSCLLYLITSTYWCYQSVNEVLNGVLTQNVSRSAHLKLFHSQQNTSLFIKQTVIKPVFFELLYPSLQEFVDTCGLNGSPADWPLVDLWRAVLSPHVLIFKPHPRWLAQIQPSSNHSKSHLQAFLSASTLYDHQGCHTRKHSTTFQNSTFPTIIINIVPFSPGSE